MVPTGTVLGAGVRCVQQRCVAPLPMPVPLPFPQLFAPTVARHGDILSRGEAAAAAAAQAAAAAGPFPSASVAEVVSVPELTRLTATHVFRDVLVQQRRQLDSAAGMRSLDLKLSELI